MITHKRVQNDPDYNPDEQILCCTISRSDGAGSYTVPLDELITNIEAEALTDAEENVGEAITIKFEVFTQQQLDDLPEFTGW